MTDAPKKPEPREATIAALVEKCKNSSELNVFIRETSLALLVRLGVEMKEARNTKDFLDMAKLWERMVVSESTKPKAKAKARKSEDAD